MSLKQKIRCFKIQYRQHIESEDGFSLMELLIVLAIIGVLLLIAIPLYQNVITTAKTTEAKTQLNFVHTLQQSYRLEYDKYSSTLQEIGFEQEALISQDGRARYKIELVDSDMNTYTATATSVVDFDGDGIFNQWKVDETGNIEQTVPD